MSIKCKGRYLYMLTFWILCEIYFTFNTVHVEERKYDYIYFSVASSECGTQDAKNYRLLVK